MKKNILKSLAITAIATALQADVTPLVTHTELGYIETSGNTKTQTFNLETNAKKSWDEHNFNFLFDAQYASNDNIDTKNKFVTELTYGYQFAKTLSLDYLVGYKDDKFSGFDYQFYTGPFLKHNTIKTPDHTLDIEGGILYSKDKYEATATAQSRTEDYAAYRAKAVYSWQMLKNLKFNQDLNIRGSMEETENYFVFSKTAFSSKISDMFSASLSYKIDYYNKPAVGRENTDKTLTLNLIFDY